MKISLEWLTEFIDWIETDPKVIAERLTVSSAEVEDVEQQGALLKKCCVGKILSVHKHPNADKLSLVDVQTDDGQKRVVCGGSNLRDGMLVAFAHVGATVKWHGGELMTLAPVKIRGEESFGMICAAEELGLETLCTAQPEDGDRPIVDLGRLPGMQPGTPLGEALGLNDTILHVSNKAIPHRPDLFSHIGFARECVALGLAAWKTDKPAKIAFPKTPCPVKCVVEDEAAVPRYCSTLIEIDALGETPQWMRRRLEATGWRCVSTPVDITNYVAMELGMPLHSFDADDLKGTLHIRRSNAGEMITTLDDVQRELPDGAVVISDDEGIFDLLGIMGGLRSSTKDSTRRIYLHSAIIDPVLIRRAIIATGHRTDASTTYEKGVPRVMAEIGLKRALELFLDIVPGAKVASNLVEWGDEGKAPNIPFSPDDCRSLLGMDVSDTKMKQIFDDLGCTVKKKAASGKAQAVLLTVTPPLWRLKDLQTERDLTEEIGRIAGFDAIAEELPRGPLAAPKLDQRRERIRMGSWERGYAELVPLSLVGPQLLKKSGFKPECCIEIDNPLGEEFSLMTPSPFPRLFEHAQNNIRISHTLKTWSMGRVFVKDMPERVVAGWVIAAQPDGLKSNPLLTLQEDLRTILHDAGHVVTVEPWADHAPFAHPGQASQLMVDGQCVGFAFTIHPDVAERFDLPTASAAARVDCSALMALSPVTAAARTLPHFPAIRYDETITRSQNQPMETLLRNIRSAHELLESVDVTDLYQPKGARDYNLTLRFTYRSPERTLTEEEAKKAHEAVMKASA